MCGILNLPPIKKGADWSLSLLYTDKDGAPVPMAGWRAGIHIRETASSPKILIALTTENSRIVLGASDGSIKLKIEDAAIPMLADEMDAVYSLVLIDTLGAKTELLEGVAPIRMGATRGI